MRESLTELFFALLVAALLILLFCVAASGADPDAAPEQEQPETRYRPCDILAVVATHLQTLSEEDQTFAFYVSLHAIPRKQREKKLKSLAFGSNSLNGVGAQLVPPIAIGEDLAAAYLDLRKLYISRQNIDRLLSLGSGPTPFPEPFFRLVTAVVKEKNGQAQPQVGFGPEYWWPGGKDHRTGKVYEPGWYHEPVQRGAKEGTIEERIYLAPWLDFGLQRTVLDATRAEYLPIADMRWFLSMSLLEPRYHELMNLDDSEASLLKLSGVDEEASEGRGAVVRGTVVASEVAHSNRALERAPIQTRFGRGQFHRSLDFKTSIRRQDLLADILNRNADAFEIIWTLPNGLQGYWISDAAHKRLDFADPIVAEDERTRMRSHLVWTARNCMGCHDAEDGVIAVDDEVRELSRRKITLAADAFSKADPLRGKRVRDKYLTIEFNELVAQDKMFYRQVVKAVTGLAPADNQALLQSIMFDYLYGPLGLEEMAWEFGSTPERVQEAITKAGQNLLEFHGKVIALDHSFVRAVETRHVRRDQFEAALGQVLLGLYVMDRPGHAVAPQDPGK